MDRVGDYAVRLGNGNVLRVSIGTRNGVVKKMDKEKKVKTKDGEVLLPTTRGRVMKVVHVAEYVYTDGVFAETSYLNMVEQLVTEYEQSLEKKDK